MSPNPPRHLAWLAPRELARRARWDDAAASLLRAQQREAAPAYPPHGTAVGGLAFWLYGSRCEGELLSTGKHCRSFGLRLVGPDGGPLETRPEVMGADRWFSKVISPGVPRPPSIVHYL